MAQLATIDERVLSIQSHVAFGYVGGKAAVFPLQCLGYDVDVINTVNFSNHSGYGRAGGTKTTATELRSMFDSLEMNELLFPERLLTGYIPGAEGLTEVARLVRKLKKDRASITYLLDPVMGDAGRLYVAPDVIPIYREMLPLATIIAPNWFEAEILAEIELTDLPSLRQALKVLHHKHKVPNVVITSIPLKTWLLEALPASIHPPFNQEHLLCISSSTSSDREGNTPTVHAQCVPYISGYFSGVGDLFSALLLAHFNNHGAATTNNNGNGHIPLEPQLRVGDTALSSAASHALSKTHAILQRTNDHARTLPQHERYPSDEEKDKANPLRKTRRMKGRELRLIQCQDIIRGTEAITPRRLEPWTDLWKVDISG